jgi:hypothetical protein
MIAVDNIPSTSGKNAIFLKEAPMKEFNELLQKVTSLTGDAAKTAAGNKSARVRLRRGMQDVISLAGDVREAAMLLTPATTPTEEN